MFNCKCDSYIAKLLLTNKKQALVLKKEIVLQAICSEGVFLFVFFHFLEIMIRHLTGVK